MHACMQRVRSHIMYAEKVMPAVLPLSPGDALAYLTVTLDTLIVLAAAQARNSSEFESADPLNPLSALPDLLFDTVFVMTAFDSEAGFAVLTRVFTTPLNRFMNVHGNPYTCLLYTSDAADE